MLTDFNVTKHPMYKTARMGHSPPSPKGGRAKRAYVQLFVRDLHGKLQKCDQYKCLYLVGMLERRAPGALERKSLGLND